MATTKAKTKTKAKAVQKKSAKKSSAPDKVAASKLGKYIEEIKIGKFSLDDVLKSTSENMDAVAEANRAMIDGYSDIAKRQYEMLKGLLQELRKVRGDRDAVVKELKRVIEHAKKDMQTLQKMANSTNAKAQQIVKKRAAANLKSLKALMAAAKKSVTGKKAPAKKPAVAKEKAPAKKKTAAKKAAPAKKKAPANESAPQE